METVIRNVGDIDAKDRQALEHVLGQRLENSQQLVIRIVNIHKKPAPTAEKVPHGQADGAKLPHWCDVYAGLSDEEIADLEKSILTRADLSRPSE
jgi:hypothetical protein